MNVGLSSLSFGKRRKRSWILIVAGITQFTDQNFQKLIIVLAWDRGGKDLAVRIAKSEF